MRTYTERCKSDGCHHLLILDPSVVTAGICILQNRWVYYTGGGGVLTTIVDHHLMVMDKPSVCDSIEDLLIRLRLFDGQYHPAGVVIEQPPLTMYNAKQSKHQIIARAQSVFQTFGAAYAAFGMFREKNIPTLIVEPSQWQPSRKKRNFMDIKPWSLQAANVWLQKLGTDSLGDRRILKTHKDENIADAINIGMRVTEDLLSGKRSF